MPPNGPRKIEIEATDGQPLPENLARQIESAVKQTQRAIGRRTYLTKKGQRLLDEYRSQPGYTPPPGFKD